MTARSRRAERGKGVRLLYGSVRAFHGVCYAGFRCANVRGPVDRSIVPVRGTGRRHQRGKGNCRFPISDCRLAEGTADYADWADSELRRALAALTCRGATLAVRAGGRCVASRQVKAARACRTPEASPIFRLTIPSILFIPSRGIADLRLAIADWRR